MITATIDIQMHGLYEALARNLKLWWGSLQHCYREGGALRLAICKQSLGGHSGHQPSMARADYGLESPRDFILFGSGEVGIERAATQNGWR